MGKLLLVDDDQSILASVSAWLRQEHHTVETASSGQEALDKLTVFDYDLIILDWELPDVSGLEVCKRLRADGKMIPVLMLTGKSGIDEKESGFDAGADDYLTKPFHPKELAVRVKAILRRPDILASPVLRKGTLELDTVARKVTSNKTEVPLQPMEFALLEFLLRHPNQLFSTEALMRRCWPDDAEVALESVYTCIRRLRKKLDAEGQPSIIRTVHSFGYILDSDQ